MEEFIDAFPEVKRIIFDGTERQIQREKRSRKTKTKLFRKKEASKEYLIKKNGESIFGEEVQIDGDSGFQGLQKERANVRIPHKN